MRLIFSRTWERSEAFKSRMVDEHKEITAFRRNERGKFQIPNPKSQKNCNDQIPNGLLSPALSSSGGEGEGTRCAWFQCRIFGRKKKTVETVELLSRSLAPR
jgi:hypothetical protein